MSKEAQLLESIYLSHPPLNTGSSHVVTKLGGRGELGEAAHVGGELEGGGGGGGGQPHCRGKG